MVPLPVGRRPSAVLARALVVPLALLAIAGCGQLLRTEPPATPTDFPGITGRLKVEGITLSEWVSGDAGRSHPTLVPASIGFRAIALAHEPPVKVYLYINRDH